MKIQTLIVSCTIDQFWLWMCQKMRYEWRYNFFGSLFFAVLIKIISFSGMAERGKSGYFSVLKYILWIYNIDAICICKPNLKKSHNSPLYADHFISWLHHSLCMLPLEDEGKKLKLEKCANVWLKFPICDLYSTIFISYESLALLFTSKFTNNSSISLYLTKESVVS